MLKTSSNPVNITKTKISRLLPLPKAYHRCQVGVLITGFGLVHFITKRLQEALIRGWSKASFCGCDPGGDLQLNTPTTSDAQRRYSMGGEASRGIFKCEENFFSAAIVKPLLITIAYNNLHVLNTQHEKMHLQICTHTITLICTLIICVSNGCHPPKVISFALNYIGPHSLPSSIVSLSYLLWYNRRGPQI